MKKVAVLGRGQSLECLNSLPDVDAYVIANNWGLELNQQFIIDRFSDNKPIIHICSLAVFRPDAWGVNVNELLKHYKDFNIQKLIFPNRMLLIRLDLLIQILIILMKTPK